LKIALRQAANSIGNLKLLTYPTYLEKYFVEKAGQQQ
jgi:hypothetical protein